MSGTATVAGNRLKSFIERIETVEVELDDHKEARKEIYTEAKGEGFDSKIIRKIVRLRKKSKSEVQEEDELTDLYLNAIGGL